MLDINDVSILEKLSEECIESKDCSDEEKRIAKANLELVQDIYKLRNMIKAMTDGVMAYYHEYDEEENPWVGNDNKCAELWEKWRTIAQKDHTLEMLYDGIEELYEHKLVPLGDPYWDSIFQIFKETREALKKRVS